MLALVTSAGWCRVGKAYDSAVRALRTMGSLAVGLHTDHQLLNRENLTWKMADHHASRLESWQSDCL